MQEKKLSLWDRIPIVVLILIVTAGGSNLLSEEAHKMVAPVLKDFGADLLPFAIHCIFALLLVRAAKRLYQPALKAGEWLSGSIEKDSPLKPLADRAIQPLYCLIIVVLVVAIVAKQVLVSTMNNLNILSGAALLVLGPFILDGFGGLWLLSYKRLKEKQRIALVGKDNHVEGTIERLGIWSSSLKTATGTSWVRNRDFLANILTELNPLTSSIYLPPGVDLTRTEEKQGTDSPTASEQSNLVQVRLRERRSAYSKDQ